MPLTPGTRLGPYEILGSIGAGGMGEVYRARDLKLGRDVAIKALPALFAVNPERLARFEREAQTLASLNHPHIAQIYGVIENPAALVMEFVDGEDLAQRLARGPLPMDEALNIARQIADALAAAHDRGIVHRDLKPANVKVRGDGVVKVLDFGLAKATEGRAEGLRDDGGASARNSPTFTARATELGTIIGTAPYMAPEQARGKDVDRRADLWAFGVVLYEMLTGRRAFEGEEISDVLAAVLRDTPPLDALPSQTPSPVRRLLRRCFEKDPAKRLDSAIAARIDLEEALAGPELESGVTSAAPVPLPRASLVRRGLPWIASTAAVLLAAGWMAANRASAYRHTAMPMTVSISPGFDAVIGSDFRPQIAFSPDGRSIVFVRAEESGLRTQLYLRRLDQLTATPIVGTEAASNPFFSPDGQWIGFFANPDRFSAQKLCKVPIAGGAPLALADVDLGRGATWGEDDVITYESGATLDSPLMRVAASGGTPAAVGTPPPDHKVVRWPQALPGNHAVLFTASSSTESYEDACLGALELPGGATKILQCGGSFWRYVPTGHVLYVHDHTLYARTFDLARLVVTGQPVAVAQNVFTFPTSGAAEYDVSSTGVLAYLPVSPTDLESRIALYDRNGKVTPLPSAPPNWTSVTFAPDGRRLAFGVSPPNAGIWVYDIDRDSSMRLSSSTRDVFPIWSPDSRAIVYGSNAGGPPHLAIVPADGSSPPRDLTRPPVVRMPTGWSPDGKTIAFEEHVDATQSKAFLLPVTGGVDASITIGEPRPFASQPGTQAHASFSPDGKWIAYLSDESGGGQVYVRDANGTGGKWQVSTETGAWPQWSRSRAELFFATFDGRIMSVTYDTRGGEFHASRPQQWTPIHYQVRGRLPSIAVSPDGERVAMAPASDRQELEKVVLITNFFERITQK